MSLASDRTASAKHHRRWIRRAQQPQEEVQMALATLRAVAVEGLGQAITRGARDDRHAPAKDLLLAAGSIERDAPNERLVILVGDGKTAVGTLPRPDARPLCATWRRREPRRARGYARRRDAQ